MQAKIQSLKWLTIDFDYGSCLVVMFIKSIPK